MVGLGIAFFCDYTCAILRACVRQLATGLGPQLCWPDKANIRGCAGCLCDLACLLDYDQAPTICAMTQANVIQHADHIETIFDEQQAAVWSLRLDDCTPEQRAFLIDHHHQVMAVLRKRGRVVRSNIVWQDGQEFITLRIVAPSWQAIEPWA